MNGPRIGSNPDELFLSAAATCFFMTLVALIERNKYDIKDISLASKMDVNIYNGRITCKRIVHQPSIIMKEKDDEKNINSLNELIIEAESNCMVSNAIRGNVKIELQSEINVV